MRRYRMLWVRVLWLCVGGSVWLGACLWQPSSEPVTPRSPTGLLRLPIIGGSPDIRHPEVGALTTNKRTFCTGTLIAKRVVLTAAHCVDAALGYAPTSSVQFRVDFPDSSKPDGFVSKHFDFDAKLFQNHPKWTTSLSNGGDIGVGILKQKVSGITPMPPNFTPLITGWIGRTPLFLGYGLIQSSPSSISPNRKYGVEIPIVRMDSDRFSHQDSGKSVCHGDSGGPAIVLMGGRHRVMGVNSYVSAARVPGTNRSTCAGSGTSMRTDAHAAFLQSVLATYGDGPETCESDQDCGQCGQCNTAKKLCEPLSPPKNAKVCQPCATDADCNGARCYRFPDGFRCLQPCTSQNCCPNDHYCAPLKTARGLGNLCMPFSNVCPALACQQGGDCGPGEFCENGFCLPKTVARHPDLCKPCTTSADCGTSSCYGLAGQKRCTQPCGPGDFCPPGFACQQPYPGVSRQCIPHSGVCHLPCMFNSNCPEGQICSKGICSAKDGGDYGAACDPGACKKPLTCTTTISGKRCLEPCNHPEGFAGSACKSGSRCNAGLSCFSLTSELRMCLGQCNTRSDCANVGGGSCSSGICYCFSDSQCATGYVCNRNSEQLGACAPSDQTRKCSDSRTCQPFEGHSYCVDEGVGSRSLGQPCDGLNRCREGLFCLPTTDGGICFEDCSQSGKCALGGACIRIGSSQRVCMCQGGLECPGERICRPYLQQRSGQYGLCESQGLSNPCVDSRECPTGYQCRRGQCLTGADLEKIPPDEPEPALEPQPEPVTEPAPSEPAPEPLPPDEPTSSSSDASGETNASDGGQRDKGTNAETAEKPAPSGCGCQATSSAAPLSGGSLLLWLLGLGWLGLRRRGGVR